MPISCLPFLSSIRTVYCKLHKMLLLTLAALLAPFLRTSAATNITVYQSNVPIAPSSLPSPGAASHADAIADAFANLGRSTIWRSVENITLEGDTDEPEGIAVLFGNDGTPSRFFVSTTQHVVETQSYSTNGTQVIINGTDRTTGAGYARILAFDGNGKRIAAATYNVIADEEYHLGGIDYDGQKIWGTIAQYRPNSTAYIVSVDPHTLKETVAFHYRDHLGGIVHDTKANDVYCLNWGARNASRFHLGGGGGGSGYWWGHGFGHGDVSQPSKDGYVSAQKVTRNPTFFVDYQDCKFLGRPRRYHGRPTMICSGLTDYTSALGPFQLGGIAIVDVETMVPLNEVPITGLSARGIVLTQNPMDVTVVDGKLRFYWMPDQHNSTVYVYEAEPNSPYQF